MQIKGEIIYTCTRGDNAMYDIPPKKMLILNIYDILKKYSDENHRLSIKEIGEKLEREYSQKVDRRAIKRNLLNLIDFGYNIEYRESTRNKKDGEEETLYTDWYLMRDFTDAELRLLIDGLLFSKHIPYSQCKELINKLKGLSNTYFEAKVKHIRNLPDNMPTNKQLFLTIEVLDEAISKERQVSLTYNRYGMDMKLHPNKNSKGEIREYIINPYQIVATNGRYYVICNNDKFDSVSNFRLDRITNIHMLDTPVKPFKNIPGMENGLNLPKHMAEHIYMFSGKDITATFRADCDKLSDVVDWFGREINFSNNTGNTVDIRVSVNENAMLYWALQYGKYIEILGPESLREQIKEVITKMAETYGGKQL